MYKKDLESYLNEMSYEQQKELVYKLEDQQSYDNNCNVVEVLVTATTAAIKALVKLIF
jgi:hypothetical protein